MARETGLSKSSVQRLWSAHAIAPHRLKSFKLSKDLASRPPLRRPNADG